MWFYIALFIFCIIMLIINNCLKEEKHRKIFEISTLVILCIISGTRYYLGGSDYYVYKAVFDTVPNIFEFGNLNIDDVYGMEIGYLYFNSIIKTMGFTFFGFTLIHSIIFYTCMYVGLKRYIPNFNFLIIIFLYKIFFYNTFISMRQSITLAIFFISIKYIKDRKFVKYFLMCTLAVLFHNGALLLYPLYFINRFKLTKKRIIILSCIFIPTLLISLLNIPILNNFQWILNYLGTDTLIDKANSLINNYSDTGINILHTLEYFTIMILIVKNYEDIIDKDDNVETILKLFLVLLPLFTLFRGYEILTREKDYFTLIYAIILFYLCNMKQKSYYIVIQVLTVVVCLAGYIRFIVSFDDGALMPYTSYITEDVTIIDKNE